MFEGTFHWHNRENGRCLHVPFHLMVSPVTWDAENDFCVSGETDFLSQVTRYFNLPKNGLANTASAAKNGLVLASPAPIH